MNYNLPFIKSVALNDLPEEAWHYIIGGDTEAADLQAYYKAIPWLYRGVAIRANAVAEMPFSIYKGETEIDGSKEYKNVVGFLPNPGALFGLVEAALTIWGYAYLFRKRSAFKTLDLRYMLPTSIVEKINTAGEIAFTRNENGKPVDYTTDDLVYFWRHDPFVEIGPPQSSPALAAASAAGVLLNVDKFAAAFFERGAIKATLLTTENIVPLERERLKAWWQRMFSGIKAAWQTDIVNAKAVTPVVVGEGLESLENSDLTESKRIDIAAALGIPYSVLFSNASNRATAEQDDLHLYTKTVIPDAEFIAAVLNDQVMSKAGYKLIMTPQNLDLFQVDEAERADSLEKLIAALEKPEEFLLASDILGYEINPDIYKKIEAMVAQKRQAAERMEVVTAQPVQPEPQPEPEPAPPPTNQRAVDLEKWRTKAIKRIKAGKPASCQFDSQAIDILTHASIGGALEGAKTEDDVKIIFADAWAGYP
jgi:HK97 family phage portal protein